jgi:DNA-binding LacI/PurR family transcriptional regulator
VSTSAGRPRRATIHEVARTAGVSHQTVSRYLRFDGSGLKDATRERISAAIAELGYRPNLAARAMRTRRIGRVAILLPTGSGTGAFMMLKGASAAAHETGRQVEAIALEGPPQARTARTLELAESGLFEGVLALSPLLPQGEEPIAGAAPIVVSADYDDEMRAIGEMADGAPMAELVEGLVKVGHRTFLHIAGDRAHAASRSRERVYLETVERLGARSAGVVGGDWSPETARREVLALPADRGVTAIIAANDSLAGGAVRGALDRGWRVPEDVSVTGWDDYLLGAWLSPTLTTVAVDYDEVGRRAMAQLVAVLQEEAPPRHEGRVASVVWRGSTGPVGGRRGARSI